MPKGHPKPCAATIDLLADWRPPEPAIRFDPDKVRGHDLATRISRAISVALKDSGEDRKIIAERMGQYLGEEVSVSALNAYASPAKDAGISHKRLVALAYALEDWRLLSIGADELDCIVVPEEFGELIKAALTAERIRELEQELAASRQVLKEAGLT